MVSANQGKRDEHVHGTVKGDDKGQVVIQAEARKELEINPGNLLSVKSGRNRHGIVMAKADTMRELAEKITHDL